MRYVSDVASAGNVLKKQLVSGLTNVQAVKSVHPREQRVTQIDLPQLEHKTLQEAASEIMRNPNEVERRKECRRIHLQHVLIELRSGIDRRHHNLRGGDVVDHIDETA